jgi:hypothetical protein
MLGTRRGKLGQISLVILHAPLFFFGEREKLPWKKKGK